MKRLLIALFLGLYVSTSFLACAPMMPKENPKLPRDHDSSQLEPTKPVGEGNAPAAKPVAKPAEKPAEEPAADEGTE